MFRAQSDIFSRSHYFRFMRKLEGSPTVLFCESCGAHFGISQSFG